MINHHSRTRTGIMDNIIKRISDIEAAASAILDEANIRKKNFAQEMSEKTISFDRELETATANEIAKLRSRMEIEMKEKLAKQKEHAAFIQATIEQEYDEHHTVYVERLFRALLEE